MVREAKNDWYQQQAWLMEKDVTAWWWIHAFSVAEFV